MKKIGKSFCLVVVILISLVASSYALPVTVTFESVDTSKADVRNSAWAGFYNLTVEGTGVLGMCDDYSTHVSTGWQAELNTYTDILNGEGRWGLPVAAYNAIGWLFMQTFDGDNAYIADAGLIADINQAIWRVHDTQLNLTGRAAVLYQDALAMTDYIGWYGYMDILTPAFVDGRPVSQEFLVRGAGPAPVPEPATMLLLGGGLIGLAGLGRRKLKK